MMFTDTDLLPQEWRLAIRELRTRLEESKQEINALDVELASLAINEEDFLDQNPGI